MSGFEETGPFTRGGAVATGRQRPATRVLRNTRYPRQASAMVTAVAVSSRPRQPVRSMNTGLRMALRRREACAVRRDPRGTAVGAARDSEGRASPDALRRPERGAARCRARVPYPSSGTAVRAGPGDVPRVERAVDRVVMSSSMKTPCRSGRVDVAGRPRRRRGSPGVRCADWVGGVQHRLLLIFVARMRRLCRGGWNRAFRCDASGNASGTCLARVGAGGSGGTRRGTVKVTSVCTP
jgi:hypothetical protein